MSAGEAPDLVPLATRVDEPLRRAVKARAAMEGRSVQDLVAQALTEYLDKQAEPGRDATKPVAPNT